MHDILMISGTRPEVIKLAPLYHALRATSWARPCWLHTGQHDAMARQMHECFDILPDVALMRGGESLAEFSARCRLQLDAILASRNWSLTVVQGDTESTYLGAVTSFYQRVPVAHVEAGLRTGNLQRPFPEEGLRQMISRITRFHFAPTDRAAAALHDEGIDASQVTVTGNTVIDAQQWVVKHRRIRRSVKGRGHLLVTAHRRENWGSDMEAICRAVADVARRHPDLPVLFPVHLNPVVQRPVHGILGGLDNVLLTPPMDYLQMQQALIDAWLVLTDSGGLQEEAPTFGVPVLVLRNETERPEAIERGCASLAGTQSERIAAQVEALWNDRDAYLRMCHAGNPFGDGNACSHIERVLRHALGTADAASMATVA